MTNLKKTIFNSKKIHKELKIKLKKLKKLPKSHHCTNQIIKLTRMLDLVTSIIDIKEYNECPILNKLLAEILELIKN